MKKFKSLLSVFMALAFAVMCVGAAAFITASANDDNLKTITINVQSDGSPHSYAAYQIFKGDVSTNEGDTNKISNIEWGSGVNTTNINASTSTFYSELNTLFGVDTLVKGTSEAKDIAELLGEYNDENDKEHKIRNGFAAIMAKYLNTAAGEANNVASGGTAAIANVPEGYYLIKETTNLNGVESAIASAYILEVFNNQTVSAKTELPTLKKVIDDGATGVTKNNASIGDIIKYKITTTVPNNIKNMGYTSYDHIIKDTLSEGLTYFEDDTHKMTVTVNGTGLTAADSGDGKYKLEKTANADNTTGLTITIHNFIKYINALNSSSSGVTVIVEYYAKLNNKAVINGDGNTNTAFLEYSNNPYSTSSKGKTTGDTVTTYTTEIEIDKVDGSNAPLAGAQFQICKVSGSSEIPFADAKFTTNGDITQADAKAYVEKDSTGTLGEGKLLVSGLGQGTYVIKETVTPSGYNTIDDITLTVTADTSGSGCSWSYSISDSSDAGLGTGANINILTVVNQSGLVLPATGGMGTTIFYVAGGSIMILAAILFITKKIVDSKHK